MAEEISAGRVDIGNVKALAVAGGIKTYIAENKIDIAFFQKLLCRIKV